jgi:hypothetical protein
LRATFLLTGFGSAFEIAKIALKAQWTERDMIQLAQNAESNELSDALEKVGRTRT